MIEEWRKVDGWPYEVSNEGRLRRSDPSRGTRPGKIVKPHLKDGYPSVTLSSPGRRKRVCVHLLVCTAFHGPPPTPRHQAAHTDGVRSNPVASNLSWKTPKENAADKHRHGTQPRGEQAFGVKLTEDCVRRMRADLRPHRTIAAEYGVALGVVGRVKRREAWQHVA